MWGNGSSWRGRGLTGSVLGHGSRFVLTCRIDADVVLTIYPQTEIRAGLTTWVGFQIMPIQKKEQTHRRLKRPPWHTLFVFMSYQDTDSISYFRQISVNASILSDSGGPCECPGTSTDHCVSDQVYLACVNEVRQDLITSTAAISALCSFLMGLFANLPVGLAPGLGLNGYVSFASNRPIRW